MAFLPTTRTPLSVALLLTLANAANAQSTTPDQPAPAANPSTPVESTPASPAPAADSAATTTDSFFDPRHTAWTVQIEPFVWFVAPSGDLRLPARSGTGGSTGGGFADSGDEVELASLNLDTPRLSPAGEMHISADRFRFTFSGAAYSISRDGTPADEAFRIGAVEVAVGEPLDVDFDFATYEVSLGYCVWAHDFFNDTNGARRANATPLVLRTYALGGVRMYDTDISVTNAATGSSAGSDEFFIEPIVGGRAELEINEVFSIDLQISAGYFSDSDKSSLSFDVAAGFVYRPIPNLGIQIGWRQIAFDLTDGEGLDEFEYSGRLAGLYTGITLRF